MSVYENVVATCKPYLGPAAEQFIARQCSLYLKREAQQLSKGDLGELAKWLELGGTRIMEPAKAKELAGKVARL